MFNDCRGPRSCSTGSLLRLRNWHASASNPPGYNGFRSPPATEQASSVVDSGEVEKERVLARNFDQSLEATRLSAVPGFHRHAEQQWVAVGLGRAQSRNILGG